MLQITDADIARVERLLLPKGFVFNEERRDFIKCMESRDVVACPGSGKTTALLAKLLILASYMPFPIGRGVCVLTHTNVAINEIKRRAGEAADALFAHPNYFGTIQGFVNRFLAIPAFRNIYKQPIQAIDNDHFFAALRSRYQSDIGLQRWIEPRGGIGTLGQYWFKPADMTIGRDMDNDIHKLSRDTTTYRKIEYLRHAILRQGILSFNDAYSLALNYLARYPGVIDTIRHRFKFVFIDEMQDTDAHQFRVIDSLFAGCNTVILQRLGDPNQAIYQSDAEQKPLWVSTDPFLPFSNSLRYGASIAKLLDTVRVDRTLTLEPNQNQPSLPPQMLLFNSGAEEKVLPAFGEIIREKSLHELESPRFCAIGWVGKDKTEEGKVCLRYYHREYQKVLKSHSRWHGTLQSYVHAMDIFLRDSPQRAGELTEIVFSAVVRALRLAGLTNPKTKRPFTTVTLRSHLKQNDDKLLASLCLQVSAWVLSFRQGEITVLQLRDTIAEFIRTHFVEKESTDLTDFLTSNAVDFTPPESGACANAFVTDAGDVIEVGTVHSVKGQTYTATIYLETSYYGILDSERLMPFCTGDFPTKHSKKVRHRANLKIAHVAFSRPTHLLAFACRNDHAEGYSHELEKAGWIVHKI